LSKDNQTFAGYGCTGNVPEQKMITTAYFEADYRMSMIDLISVTGKTRFSLKKTTC